MIDVHPTKCNLCGGNVRFTSNVEIYGKEYGSGKCYICDSCRAYIGTHKPRPTEAFGILANPEMRKWKKKCHSIFDQIWNNREQRKALYAKMASELNIPVNECHFGYMDMEMLKKAYSILERWNS